MTVSVFHARLFHSFREHDNLWYQIFSHGTCSVAIYASCGGICNNHFIANSLENLSVQKFQNQLRIDRVTALSLVFHSVEVTISHCSSRQNYTNG